MSVLKVIYGGEVIDLTKLEPRDISALHIQRALSNIARFDGASEQPYSVAQHSVYVANLAKENGATDDLIFSALMHDSAEAYIGDLSSPLKAHCPAYTTLEKKIQNVIFEAFGFVPHPFAADFVKPLDLVALCSEFRDLFGIRPGHKHFDNLGFDAPLYYSPTTPSVIPLSPDDAYCEFMDMLTIYSNKLFLTIPN